MIKPDWAERMVRKVWKRQGGLLSGDDMVKLLRAERRWAVRKCKQVKLKGMNSDLKHEIKIGISYACDDCVKTIQGEKP